MTAENEYGKSKSKTVSSTKRPRLGGNSVRKKQGRELSFTQMQVNTPLDALSNIESKLGRKGDPRMHKAVAARLLNPQMSLLEALLAGGFQFPHDLDGKNLDGIYDADNVHLYQRKNQLSRRLRIVKQQTKEKMMKKQQVERKEKDNCDDTLTEKNLHASGLEPVSISAMGGNMMSTTGNDSADFYAKDPLTNTSCLASCNSNEQKEKDSNDMTKKALNIFRVEVASLLKRCMLTAGYSPEQTDECDVAYLNFAERAVHLEQNRIAKIRKAARSTNDDKGTPDSLSRISCDGNRTTFASSPSNTANNSNRNSGAVEAPGRTVNNHSDHHVHPHDINQSEYSIKEATPPKTEIPRKTRSPIQPNHYMLNDSIHMRPVEGTKTSDNGTICNVDNETGFHDSISRISCDGNSTTFTSNTSIITDSSNRNSGTVKPEVRMVDNHSNHHTHQHVMNQLEHSTKETIPPKTEISRRISSNKEPKHLLNNSTHFPPVKSSDMMKLFSAPHVNNQRNNEDNSKTKALCNHGHELLKYKYNSTDSAISSCASDTSSAANGACSHAQHKKCFGGRHVHQLEGKCGHKAIIHKPGDGSAAHVDFVVNGKVECYQGIRPVGNTATRVLWPSSFNDKLTCASKIHSQEVEVKCGKATCENDCEELTKNIDPKIFDLDEIDFDGDEWNLDSGDEALMGFFKLGNLE